MNKWLNDLLTEVDSIIQSVLLSLDICAAFDTLDRLRLLQRKEQIFSVVGAAMEYLGSHFSKRKAFHRGGRATFQNCDVDFRRAPRISFDGPTLDLRFYV